MGVFAIDSRRVSALPETTARSFATMFRSIVGGDIAVVRWLDIEETEVVRISTEALKEEARFRVPERALHVRGNDALLYYASVGLVHEAGIVEVDLGSLSARRIGSVPGQLARHPQPSAEGLVFATTRHRANVLLREPNGRMRPLTDGTDVHSAGRCGGDFVIGGEERDRSVVKRIDARGSLVKILAPGPTDGTGACSSDGRIWYFSRLRPSPAIRRCDDSDCRDIFSGVAAYPTVSPDGTRIAFMAYEARGPVVYWERAEGGPIHEVSETETACAAGWASSQTLWISRRRDGKVIWTQVDADSGRELGQTVAGSRDCSDGRPDPASPIDPGLRIVYDQRSQLRLLAREHLKRN